MSKRSGGDLFCVLFARCTRAQQVLTLLSFVGREGAGDVLHARIIFVVTFSL